jgi:hypothetical protein
MFYFEIKNNRTGECANTTASNMTQACAKMGWKPWDCKCVYRAKEER